MTGLPYQTFAAWIQRRRHERGDYRMKRAPAGGALRRGGPEKAVRLVEVMLARPDPAAGTVDAPALRVELPCGTRLLVEKTSRVP